jgi:hypothetical protein
MYSTVLATSSIALDKNATQIKTLKRAYNMGKKYGLNYIYFGNVDVPDIT